MALTPDDFKRNPLFRGDTQALEKRYINISIHKKKKADDGGYFADVFKAFDTIEKKDKAIKFIEADSI